MSFFDCVEDAMNDDDVRASREKGERAQRMWKDFSDRYERQGHQRHTAEAMAGEDVKTAFRKEAGEIRHVYLARISNMRELQARASAATKDNIVWAQTRTVEQLDYETRGLVRRFNGRLGQFLKDHHSDLIGRTTNPMQLENFAREMHGQRTGDVRAKALADGVSHALEDQRLMFNEYGGIIGRLDDWGLPHSHNRGAMEKAGFDTWFDDIRKGVDWTRLEDDLTGLPFQRGDTPPDIDMQRRFLQEVYDNRVLGKDTREAIYGKQTGVAKYKQRADSRVLHFKSADDWLAYNTKYGNGTPLSALMGHVHGMAHDIAMMKSFGPNPRLGLEYQQQLFEVRARELGDQKLLRKVSGNGNHAARMSRVLSGPGAPSGPVADLFATFMSNVRHGLTAAFLDKAIVASISDFNSMRLTANAIGVNPNNVMSRYVESITGMVKDGTLATDDLLRHQWVMDTLADPGAALARFQNEIAPSAIMETISNASMRIQGLPMHTDALRFAFQMEMWGTMARDAGKPFADIDPNLRSSLMKKGLTSDQWEKFSDPTLLDSKPNGSTFANPLYWREVTDIPAREADDIFLKVQSFVEEFTEVAVPTQSLLAKGVFEPSAYGMTPGSIPYEMIKSSTMFKSFVMAFSVNQHRMIMMQGGYASSGGVAHMFNLAAGATVIGAMSVQIGEILKGNDPMAMDGSDFWFKAAMKGGGFAIVGDIIQTGQSSWGGGFGEYLFGPIPQLMTDAWNLTIKNAYQLAAGDDPKFAEELARYGKRYTPMGQTPMLGPTVDRLLWDQLQLSLDPESRTAMDRKARNRQNRDGNAGWWLPGSPVPSRAPDLGSVFN